MEMNSLHQKTLMFRIQSRFLRLLIFYYTFLDFETGSLEIGFFILGGLKCRTINFY